MLDFGSVYNVLTAYTPGPYAEFFPGGAKSYSPSVVVSTGPYMLIDFVTDGSDVGVGAAFIVSLNLRPTSM